MATNEQFTTSLAKKALRVVVVLLQVKVVLALAVSPVSAVLAITPIHLLPHLEVSEADLGGSHPQTHKRSLSTSFSSIRNCIFTCHQANVRCFRWSRRHGRHGRHGRHRRRTTVEPI